MISRQKFFASRAERLGSFINRCHSISSTGIKFPCLSFAVLMKLRACSLPEVRCPKKWYAPHNTPVFSNSARCFSYVGSTISVPSVALMKTKLGCSCSKTFSQFTSFWWRETSSPHTSKSSAVRSQETINNDATPKHSIRNHEQPEIFIMILLSYILPARYPSSLK